MGQVVIFKDADFSNCAIPNEVFYQTIISETDGSTRNPISGLFPINKEFTRKTAITSIKFKKQELYQNSRRYTVLCTRTLGDGMGGEISSNNVILPLLENSTEWQTVVLDTPLIVDAGEYLCCSPGADIPDYPEGAKGCDMAYGTKNTESLVSTECCFLKSSDFSDGNITPLTFGNSTIFFSGEVYGYYV
jgi:hypothetical protein